MNADALRQTPVLAADPAAVAEAVALLAAGEVVGLPTETVYGLAGDAGSARAVAAIFQAKERPLSDPLIVHLPAQDWLGRVARLAGGQAELAQELIARFWPGPLTLILPLRPAAVCADVTAGSGHVALRMSAHPVFRAVIEKLDRPLAAPSANRFGRISPTTAAHVLAELSGRIPLILDGGPTEHGLESTIVALAADGKSLRILRHGPITVETLRAFGSVSGPPAGAIAAAAPGQMENHYAPRTPLVLVQRRELEADFALGPSRKWGLLAFRRDEPPASAVFARTEYLTDAGDLREAAANLFGALRRLDESGVARIIAEGVPEEGLGRAIMERLRRAAAGAGR